MRSFDGQILERLSIRPVTDVADRADRQRNELLRRAEHLGKDDRLLITCFLTTGFSQRKIADLMRQAPGTVARRLKRLAALLVDPHIVHLIDGPCSLDPTDRQIAIGYLLRRQSVRELSQIHGLSKGQVARRLNYFQGWMKARGDLR